MKITTDFPVNSMAGSSEIVLHIDFFVTRLVYLF